MPGDNGKNRTPIDGRQLKRAPVPGVVSISSRPTHLSGVRAALERVATSRRKDQLFRRLFDHALEKNLQRERKRLAVIKANYRKARDAITEHNRLKPCIKNRKKNPDIYLEWGYNNRLLQDALDDIDEDKFDCRREIKWSQSMVSIGWGYLIKRLVPEWKVIESDNNDGQISPQLISLILSSYGEAIKRKEAEYNKKVFDISDDSNIVAADYTDTVD